VRAREVTAELRRRIFAWQKDTAPVVRAATFVPRYSDRMGHTSCTPARPYRERDSGDATFTTTLPVGRDTVVQ